MQFMNIDTLSISNAEVSSFSGTGSRSYVGVSSVFYTFENTNAPRSNTNQTGSISFAQNPLVLYIQKANS